MWCVCVCVCVCVEVLDLTAELDCLMALSHASQEYGYTSPSLANHRRIVLAEARYTHTTSHTHYFTYIHSNI